MAGEVLDQNPSRPQTRVREAGKWLLWRVLPRSWYQRVLARAKVRDFRSGIFREPELDLVGLALEPGAVAVDVGANHGMWTLALSDAVGPDGTVLAFEPVPFTFGTLAAVADRTEHSNVMLMQAGCSDAAGSFKMVIPDQDAGASDDLQAHLADRDGDPESHGSTSVTCEMVRLDDVLDTLSRVDMIKLDIEGAELKALQGARQSIMRHEPTVICEVDRGYLAGFGQTPGELSRFMSELGYSAYHYRSEDSKLMPMDSLDSVRHGNIVFATPGKLGRLESLIS